MPVSAIGVQQNFNSSFVKVDLTQRHIIRLESDIGSVRHIQSVTGTQIVYKPQVVPSGTATVFIHGPSEEKCQVGARVVLDYVCTKQSLNEVLVKNGVYVFRLVMCPEGLDASRFCKGSHAEAVAKNFEVEITTERRDAIRVTGLRKSVSTAVVYLTELMQRELQSARLSLQGHLDQSLRPPELPGAVACGLRWPDVATGVDTTRLPRQGYQQHVQKGGDNGEIVMYLKRVILRLRTLAADGVNVSNVAVLNEVAKSLQLPAWESDQMSKQSSYKTGSDMLLDPTWKMTDTDKTWTSRAMSPISVAQ